MIMEHHFLYLNGNSYSLTTVILSILAYVLYYYSYTNRHIVNDYDF